jgi:hypothetical protein
MKKQNIKKKIKYQTKYCDIYDITFLSSTECPVRSRIWFSEEKRPYRVRARSDRYIVCTKPHNPIKTVIYTVIDLVNEIRGTENLVFGVGAETDKDCKEMLKRLDGQDKELGWATEVSRRNRIPLNVSRIDVLIT